MSRYLKLGTVLGLAFVAQSASAQTTTYEFTAKNNSSGPMVIAIDGKTGCTADAGQSCKLDFTKGDAALTYSLAGKAPVSFSAGNLEATEVCNIDSSGAHCIDPTGQPTN